MSLLDCIEAALQPLRAELTTSCVLCGQAVGAGTPYARAGELCVCRRCIDYLGMQVWQEVVETPKEALL